MKVEIGSMLPTAPLAAGPRGAEYPEWGRLQTVRGVVRPAGPGRMIADRDGGCLWATRAVCAAWSFGRRHGD